MLWRSLRGFFRGFWRGLDALRRTVHLFLMLLVLVALVAVIAARPDKLPDAFVLIVSPEGMLVEQYSGDPVSRAFDAARGLPRTQTLVSDLVDAIDEAADDPRVTAIHLEVDLLVGGSLDKLATVAAALERFRDAGKPVIGSAANLPLGAYYLAAHADELYLEPLGIVPLQGFGFYRHYFRSALDKLSLDWYVFSAGEAKSFADPYTRDEMSAAARENLVPIADGMWAAWREDVARVRGLEPALLDDYIDRFLPRLKAAGGDTARTALDARLVDGLRTLDEVEQRLAETGGRDRDGNYVGVDAENYLAAVNAKRAKARAGKHPKPAVALIVARGDIMPGEQPAGMIGDETLRELLREVLEDDQLRALVLRVDSGGGSMFASEAIMRELELIRAAGKPLVVSMGGVAASGGYMISMGADEIWAHPTTVTGSIGVVGMFPNFGRLLERLGISVDGVGTHRYSGQLRLDREFSPEVMEIVETIVAGAYDRFLGQVADAREMPMDEVRDVAEGRIWLGQVALEAGLVDRLGTLDEALASAADRAGLGEDFEVMLLEPGLSFGEQMMVELLGGAARVGFTAWPRSMLERMPVEVRTLFTELERMDGFADPRGIYYHCFCD
ncbi:MAG: signal peptide peptidase SppA [Gammaproteobacteria bacterium]